MPSVPSSYTPLPVNADFTDSLLLHVQYKKKKKLIALFTAILNHLKESWECFETTAPPPTESPTTTPEFNSTFALTWFPETTTEGPTEAQTTTEQPATEFPATTSQPATAPSNPGTTASFEGPTASFPGTAAKFCRDFTLMK